jgi:hypothetical protein
MRMRAPSPAFALQMSMLVCRVLCLMGRSSVFSSAHTERAGHKARWGFLAFVHMRDAYVTGTGLAAARKHTHALMSTHTNTRSPIHTDTSSNTSDIRTRSLAKKQERKRLTDQLMQCVKGNDFNSAIELYHELKLISGVNAALYAAILSLCRYFLL